MSIVLLKSYPTVYWAPTKIKSLAAWYEAVDEDAILVKATQPTPDDWDFETAGVGQWTAQDSTLTKVSGYGTAQAIHIVQTGTGPNALASQLNKFIVGNRVSVGADCRSDGTANIRCSEGATLFFDDYPGGSSTDWEHRTGEITITTGHLYFYSTNVPSSVGAWTEFDSFVATNLSRTRWNPTAGVLPALAQATATKQPYYYSLGGVYFAVEDVLVGWTKATTRFLHDGTGCTVFFVITPVALAADTFLLSSTGSAGSIGMYIYWNSTGVLEYTVSNGGGTAVLQAISAAGVIVAGQKIILAATMDASGSLVLKSGEHIAEDTSVVGSFSTGDAGLDPAIGGYAGLSGYGIQGSIYEIIIYDEVLSDSNLDVVGNYLADKHDLTWFDSNSIARLPSLAAWYEAVDEDATLVKATQPTLTDADMETAGTAAYASVNSAILSKQGSAHSGSQCLRCTVNAAGSYGAARQYTLITGNRYSSTMWCRGDGTAYSSLYMGGYVASGTSSTSWQELTGEGTAAEPYAGLYTIGGIGTYSDGDDWTTTNLSRTRWNPTAGSLGGYFYNATAAQQPWWNGDGVEFASSDKLEWSVPLANQIFLHDDSDLTVSMCVTLPSTLVDSVAMANTIGIEGPGIMLWITATGVLALSVLTTGTLCFYPESSAGVLTAGAICIITIVKTATYASVRLDGVQVGLDDSLTGTLSSSNGYATLTIGNYPPSSAGPGFTIHEIVFDKSVDHIDSIERDLAAEYGVALP